MLLLLLACAPDAPAPLTVVTFNTGTTEGLPHDDPPDDGYTSDHAAISDAWYGDGLAWLPAVEATRAWFADLQPDVVAFQEVFWTGACADIPVEHHADFACEGWTEDTPTVALQVLGPGYQVACHPGKPDKCLGVRAAFGRFAGCDEDLCLEGLDGFTVAGCGSGARVARGVIERADGGALTVVNLHGSSGFSGDDQACRVAQFEQAFVDLGDGAPGASGAENLVLGDLNTDPGRLTGADPGAARRADPCRVSAGGRPDAMTPLWGLLRGVDYNPCDFFEFLLHFRKTSE
ncbi:MAG: hypothetical protein H6739_12135 [Alphaproteobacteria bacterium]|nr:hypothetical protein [Alphaproteobacteria bacterium]